MSERIKTNGVEAPDLMVVAIQNHQFLVQGMGDELVVFDRILNTAHLLNARATTVFHASANGAFMSELEPLMGEADGEKRTAMARLTVSELERAGLVTTTGEAATRMSRRAILKTLGSAATLPMVVSILAPTPAAAQSATANGVPGDKCVADTDCGGCVGECLCKAVSSGVKKCCINGPGQSAGGLGDPCSNNNDCCCPFLECPTGGGPKFCQAAVEVRSCPA